MKRQHTPFSRLWEWTQQWIWSVVLIAVVLAIWEVAVRIREVPAWLLPPPSAIGNSVIDDRDLLLHHAGATLQEVLLGFVLALSVGLLLAIAIVGSRIVERALYPIVIASQTVPIPAIAPLMLIWFGYGLFPKVLITALIGFFPIVVSTVDGLRSLDPALNELFRTLNATWWQRLRLAMLPAALPAIFSGARIAVAVCVIGAVFGELFGASEGLGYLLQRSSAQFLTARVFACIMVLSLMGVTLFGIVTIAERVFLPWRRIEAGR